MASCILVASCANTTPDSEPEDIPIGHSKENSRVHFSGPQVELHVVHVSISGNKVTLDVINRTALPLNAIKGKFVFRDERDKPIFDSLIQAIEIPFSYLSDKEAFEPGSKKRIEVEVFVPTSTKRTEVLIKQARYSDGTVMQFKPSHR